MKHCLIFDIGKTNKKAFVFDEDYRIVFEKTTQLPETTDDDSDPCEDINSLKKWVLDTFLDILEDERFDILAINCTTYGASFVCIGKDGKPFLPLYNYLKPFPENLKKQFFNTYGGEERMSLETASPSLGSLNSGLQLYRLKHQKPADFRRIKYALHLPQYIACLLHNVGRVQNPSDVFQTELTSIGCHTMLWDFQKNDYHEWVQKEGITDKFPPLRASDSAEWVPIPISVGGKYQDFCVGVGLHDSSAALIPYLMSFREPFALISTGTWSISLNPFNDEPLRPAELAQDCLCYLTFQGKPVKASRLFAGYEHEQAVKRIAAQFGVSEDFYRSVQLSAPGTRDQLSESYTRFMRQLIENQVASTRLALGASPVRRIFVDGGFSKNEIFMNLLAASFPEMEVFAAEVAQATALGAALAIHSTWNKRPVPDSLISLKKYQP